MSCGPHYVLHPYELVGRVLMLLWVAVVGFHESMRPFKTHVSQCPWPELDDIDNPTRVLVVADPQILDRRSYPGRAEWLVHLSAFLVDINLRKSWRAAMTLRPHAVVFLGDMMDGGRADISDEEYEAYFRRFRWVFRTDNASEVPTYFLPGNHDVGLGYSPEFSSVAGERYMAHFGPLNQVVTLGNHTVIFVDAPGLVAEDEQRSRSGVTHEQWRTMKPSGPIAFVESLALTIQNEPTVLFTHIPLARPERADCGPLRERGTIRLGRGFGYQNTLGPQLSQYLLKSTHPLLVMSGDDHDYCEYVHTYSPNDRVNDHDMSSVREVTVKSISMAMGVRRPGFQLLTLGAPAHASSPALADAPCLLPDQLGIYLNIYLPFVLATLLVLFLSNLHRVCTRGRYYASAPPCGARPRDDSSIRSLPPPGTAPGKLRRSRSRSPCCSCNPPRGRRPRRRPPLEVLYGALVRSLDSGRDRDADAKWAHAGLVSGLVRSVFDVAWAPLVLFVGFTWWVF
ncbi:Metallo-dependent phosphatase [Amylocystis lapponica]|nr:Metallo-dependent phosphatase [Amylocystis lapponica]